MSDKFNWLHLLPASLFLFLSFLYLFAIPVGESPDEPGHLQCIEQVSQHNRLPITEPKPRGEWWSRGVTISGRMCYHMPLYYLLGGFTQRTIAAMSQSPRHFEFPPSNPQYPRASAMFLHEDKPTFWHLPEPLSLIGLRLLSIGLGGFTLWAGYYVALRVFLRQKDLAILSATMVAGWPQFVYLSRAINNDALATALAVGILVILLRVGRPYRFIGAAFLAALAVLTKLSVVFTVGTIFGTWVLESVILCKRKKAYVYAMLLCLAVWGITWVIIRLQPTLYAHFNQGMGQFTTISYKARTLTYWQDVLQLTLSSGWARFGWMNVPAPMWHATVWWVGIILTSLAGLSAVWRSQQTKQGRLIMLILAIWGIGILASYLRINLNRLQPQFRFMLAVLPIVTTFSAAGVFSWFRSRSQPGRTAIILLTLFLLTYNCWVVIAIIRPVYGWYF